MHASGFLPSLGVVVVAAALVALAARALRMPSIVAYLVAGVLLGPVGGWLVAGQGAHGGLDTLGEMGIVLLMFLVGTELSLERLKQVGKVALVAGIGQVVFTAAGGLLVCLALDFSLVESIFIATALTFSSTVVVVKLLDQKGELHLLYGRIAVGIFLVQDLVVIVVLTLLSGLAGGAQEPDALGWSLARAFGGMGVLLGICLLAARLLLPRPFRWAARSRSTLFIWSLGWCLSVVVAATAMGLSVELGAFLAGMSIAQLDSAHDLRRRLHPLMSFFIAVFFVTLGARMELASLADFGVEAAVLSLFVLIGNPFIFMWIIARHGYSERIAFLTSVTVAQISEFSFIFAGMGVSLGLIEAPILSLVGMVGLITIALSAYMILYNERLYAWLGGTPFLAVFRAAQTEDDETPAERPHGHAVVVGMNDLGLRIVRELHARGERVLAIDVDSRKLEALPCETLLGDVGYPVTLEEAGLRQARLCVSAMRIESTNKYLAFQCRRWGVPVVVYAFDRAMLEQLSSVGADHVIESKRESARRLHAALVRSRGTV